MALSLLAPFVLLLVSVLALRWMLPRERRRTPGDPSITTGTARVPATSESGARTGERSTVERRVTERRVA